MKFAKNCQNIAINAKCSHMDKMKFIIFNKMANSSNRYNTILNDTINEIFFTGTFFVMQIFTIQI